jgi:hypothetical protein
LPPVYIGSQEAPIRASHLEKPAPNVRVLPDQARNPFFPFDLIEVGAQFAVDSTVMRTLPRPASSTGLTLEVTLGS